MSDASRRTGPAAGDRNERLQPWTAALLTALVHLLLLLLVLWAPPFTMAPQRDGAAGGAIEVTFIDRTPEQPPAAPARKPSRRAPRVERVQTTLVARARDPVPPDIEIVAAPPVVEPPRPEEPAPTPPEATPRPTRRPGQAWGQPPGMLPADPAPANPGPARGRAGSSRGNLAPSTGTSMEVGGYQVYYDLLDEARLRAWRDQGMTELFLPLPGTRRYMVCPLEIALHRDSGDCRLVEPDAPELDAIGDARDVIVMQRVYRLGEVLWSGPGAYR